MLHLSRVSGKEIILLRIRNPWGRRCWKGHWREGGQGWSQLDPGVASELLSQIQEGEFWVEEEEFFKEFDEITIGFPVTEQGQFQSLYTEQVLSHTQHLCGSWVKGQSAGGCRNNSSFPINPKFWLRIWEQSEVCIALLQKPRKYSADWAGRIQNLTHLAEEGPSLTEGIQGKNYQAVGLHVWKVEKKRFNLPKTLSAPPVVGTICHSYDREVHVRCDLAPGYYLIVPSTFLKDAERDFLLRVFSTGRICLSEIKPPPSDAALCEELSPGEWETVQLQGCWKNGQSAGGSRNFHSFHTNPCFPLSIPAETGERNVKVTLRQHCQDSKFRPIGFHIFQVPNSSWKSHTSSFLHLEPLVSCVPHCYSQEVSQLCKLSAGNYVIVPSTYLPNTEGKFTVIITTKIDRKCIQSQETLGQILHELAQIHGNIFTLWLGQSPVIVLHGFQAVKNGLTNNPEDVSGRPTTPFFNKEAGDKGIMLTSGHTWKQQRRFALMILRNLGMGKKGLEQRIQEEARHLVEYLTSERGQPLDPSVSFSQAFSNVICSVVLGHRFDDDDETLQQLLKANACLLKSAGSLSETLYNTFPWLMDHLPGLHKKMQSSHEFLYSFAKEEIRCHRERGVPDEPQDFIDFYLAQMVKCRDDPTSTFDEGSLIQSILDFFIAGTESTATTLRWALISLVLHPDVQEKVQKELDVVLGPSQLICYEDRKNLPYTNAVIHEIQRYHCIAPVGVPRQCVKDTTLLGSPVPKGTTILPNICSVLADPEQWETPRQFNPAHFLDKEGNFMSRDAFLPFSAGHRVCLGERLARAELFIFFTNLLRAFTFSLPEGVTEINTDRILGGLLQPHHYKICAIPR